MQILMIIEFADQHTLCPKGAYRGQARQRGSRM